MKNLIIKYWYIPPVILTLLMLSLMMLFTQSPSVIESVIGILLLIILITLLISWIVLCINKKWWKFLASFLITILDICFLGLPLSLFATLGPDGFGKDHPIPDGLKCNIPLVEDSCSTAPVDSLDSNTYLVIWNDIQGGMYKYDFYHGPLPAGEIFLRCFEVTENIPLSEDRLEESSRVEIDSTTSFSKLVNKQEFTIYEGDWEDYYAARVEVWHRNAATKQERKLLEKVYRIEGWMR